MKTEAAFISKIEKVRTALIKLAARSTLGSPEVIRASTTLDQMLNKYEKYRTRKNSKH
jgi:hypothetical protein